MEPMRTLFVCSLFAACAISGIAADDSGPRLLENQIREQPKQTASLNNLPKSTIRMDVNMALVPVTVMDTTGHNVLGLSRENFRVFEGNEQRPIVSFGRSDAP